MPNRWEFPKNTGGEYDGFNDSGIETFRGSPISSLAREVIQNSLDVRVDKQQPVQVHFEQVEIDASEFPDREGLKEALARSIEKESELPDTQEKTLEWLKNAMGILEQPSVTLLKVSDTNTTGLIGPCEFGTTYYAFVKARGQSIKSSGQAGGSFGIGKWAPFALSDLRTVFVSTAYDEDSNRVELAQGKAVLMGHRHGDSTTATTKGSGYFGNPADCGPIDPVDDTPAWLRREESLGSGTTLFVAGFSPREQWQELLLASVISNYFTAISDRELEVYVNGSMRVDADNLWSWFENEALMEAAKAEEQEGPLALAKSLARCVLPGENVIEEGLELDRLGLCRVRVVVDEDLEKPKKVGVIRNGMLVTEKLAKLTQFQGFQDFAAVVDLLGDDGNQYLRSMENPQHNDFQPERLGEQRSEGQKALRELGTKVREFLKNHAIRDHGPTTQLDELAEFFSDPDSGPPEPGEDEVNPEGNITIELKPRRRLRPPVPTLPDPEDEGGGGGDGEGGGGGGGGFGDGEGGDGLKKARHVKIGNPRCPRPTVGGDATRRTASFTPAESGVIDVILEMAGQTVFEVLKVESAAGSGCEVRDEKIVDVEIQKGVRCSIEVKFPHPVQGAVRISTIKWEVEDEI